jgi:hypothetical protein
LFTRRVNGLIAARKSVSRQGRRPDATMDFVAKASKPTGSRLHESGWAALGDGRWEEARMSFEDAIADEETPEAYEGLSWAAWWLDDADTVFEARERAFRLYRQREDAPSAARMAT